MLGSEANTANPRKKKFFSLTVYGRMRYTESSSISTSFFFLPLVLGPIELHSRYELGIEILHIEKEIE